MGVIREVRETPSGSPNKPANRQFYVGGKLNASVGRDASVIVAAANSLDNEIAGSDYAADTTNDTAMIAAALTAGAGKEVKLAAGTYYVDLSSAALTLPANTILRGAGMGRTIIICSTGRTWGSIKLQDGCALEDLTIIGAGISNEHLVYVSTAIATADCKARISRVNASGAGGRNFYLINSLPYTTVLDVTLEDIYSDGSLSTNANDGGVYSYNVNILTINGLTSRNNRCKIIYLGLAQNSVARITDVDSDTDAGGIKFHNSVRDSYFAGCKVDIVNPRIFNCGNMGIESSGFADCEYTPVTIHGGVLDKCSANGLDCGGGRGWKVIGTRVTRCNFGGAGWAQLEDGTGTFTGSPVKLRPGANTIECTAAGTAIVRLPAGAATSTAASGTATVTGSPVTLNAQFNTITVEGAGTITVTVTDSSIEGSGFTNGHECEFVCCTFENNWRAGVNFWQNDGNKLHGCTIRNNNQNADSTHFGVTLWAYTLLDTCYKNQILGNTIIDDQAVAAKALSANAAAGTKIIELAAADVVYFFPGQYVHVVEGGTNEYNWVDWVDGDGIHLLYALANSYTVAGGATIAGTPTQDYGVFEHETNGDTDYNSILFNRFAGNTVAAVRQLGYHDTVFGNDGYIGPGEIRTNRVALSAGLANAIGFYWANPEAQPVYIRRIYIVVATPGGTVGSHLDVGIADDAAGTNRGTEFFDDLLLNTAQMNDSYVAGDGGTQTKPVRCEASGSGTDAFVAGQILDANASALAGYAVIEYMGAP